MIQIQSFSTSCAPAHYRAASFEKEMASLFSVGLAVKSTSARPFCTELLAYRSERLQFASLRFSPHSTTLATRPGHLPARLLVTMQKEGVATVAQGGRENRIEAGDIVMVDLTRPFEIESGEILTHSIYLDPGQLRELMPQAEALTALPIKSRNGPGAMFRAIFDELFALAPALEENLEDRIAAMLPHALATALCSLKQADETLPSRMRVLHKQRVRQYIREHLRQANLNPEVIGQAVKLSPRSIYELFTDEPLPVMKWIWAERLDRCHRELAVSALRSRPIGEIAYSWGFSNVAHFSRAFRERFGLSPREHRKRSGSQIHTAALTRAADNIKQTRSPAETAQRAR